MTPTPSILDLFRVLGWSTADIAERRNMPESAVLRRLTEERAQALGRPVGFGRSPYTEGRMAKWRQGARS